MMKPQKDEGWEMLKDKHIKRAQEIMREGQQEGFEISLTNAISAAKDESHWPQPSLYRQIESRIPPKIFRAPRKKEYVLASDPDLIMEIIKVVGLSTKELREVATFCTDLANDFENDARVDAGEGTVGDAIPQT